MNRRQAGAQQFSVCKQCSVFGWDKLMKPMKPMKEYTLLAASEHQMVAAESGALSSHE